MRILFKDFYLPYLIKDAERSVGGWTVQLSSWLKGINSIGHHAGVMTWQGATDYVGKKVCFDLLDTYDPNRGLKFLKYFYYVIPIILRTARRYKPDIIIQATASLDIGIMAFVANKIGVPFIYRVANDTDVDERYKARLRKYAQIAYRYGLSKASAILCQNKYQYECLKKKYPTTPLYILHNPFDIPNELPSLRPRRERNYFAWLGLFGHQKNMSLLYDIAKAKPDIEFKVAGEPLKNIDKVTSNVLIKLKQLKNVNFVGFVRHENVRDFLAGAIGLLSTSLYEGFSNTFLEAFVSGTPVIAPLRVDPDHIITRNKLGLTSEQDKDLQNLVSLLNAMAPDRFEELSKRCRSYVIANHVPETKARELIEILTRVTNNFT